MRRRLQGAFELDDDLGRIDLEAVHNYLAEESYYPKFGFGPPGERLLERQ